MTTTFWLIEYCDYNVSTPIGLRSNLSRAIDDVEREFGMLQWKRTSTASGHVGRYEARLSPRWSYYIVITPIDLDGPMGTDILDDLRKALALTPPVVGSAINFPQLADVEEHFVLGEDVTEIARSKK